MNIFLIISAVILSVDSARILAVFPTPSISHQVVFRPLIHELIKRGHEVVLITPDPSYPNGEGPENLIEIDMHDIAYKPWADYIPEKYHSLLDPSKEHDPRDVTEMMTVLYANVVKEQLISEPIKKLITDKTQKFDLLFIEAYQRTALVFSHIFKAPVIQMSSFGNSWYNLQPVGAVMHPILHPDIYNRKILNLTFYEKIREYSNFAARLYVTYSFEDLENKMLEETVGPNIPTISKLAENVDMVFLNIHPIWEFNRPVPPNIIYLGALHVKPEKELPKDLKSYLDSSKNGVIYVSFGTNVDPSMFPQNAIDAFVKVFAELPYEILWKWSAEVSGLPKNVKILKWLPQRDLLMHPNVKLFITQGGLQSTDETILAEVPVIGIPMIGDQWYNVDMYVHHGIGVRLDVASLDAEKFKNAINTVINNKSYKENIAKLRSIMHDQPESSLDRAVWWTEYVLRHKGAKHLRAAGANLSWSTYYELELVLYILTFACIVTVLVIIFAIKFVRRLFSSKKKIKRS